MQQRAWRGWLPTLTHQQAALESACLQRFTGEHSPLVACRGFALLRGRQRRRYCYVTLPLRSVRPGT